MKNIVCGVFVRVNRFRKSVVAGLLAALCAVSARAQEVSSGFDLSFAKTVLDNIKSGLESFWTNNQASILAILGLVVLWSLIWFVLKLFKRGTSRA